MVVIDDVFPETTGDPRFAVIMMMISLLVVMVIFDRTRTDALRVRGILVSPQMVQMAAIWTVMVWCGSLGRLPATRFVLMVGFFIMLFDERCGATRLSRTIAKTSFAALISNSSPITFVIMISLMFMALEESSLLTCRARAKEDDKHVILGFECSLEMTPSPYRHLIQFDLFDILLNSVIIWMFAIFSDWTEAQRNIMHFNEQSIQYGVSKFNISLNTISSEGYFEMRTLLDTATTEVFPHRNEILLLEKAAEEVVSRTEHATDQDYNPFIRVDEPNNTGKKTIQGNSQLATRLLNYTKNKVSSHLYQSVYN